MPEHELPPKHLSENETATDTTRKDPKETDRTRTEAPPVPAPVQTNRKKPPHHCEITCRQEEDWWGKAKPFVEIAGVVLLGAYTLVTVLTFREISKQTPDISKSARAADDAARLNRELTEGAQAAVIVVSPQGDSHWSDDGKTVIVYPTGTIFYSNEGKVAAFNLNGAFALETRLIPENKVLGSQSIKIHKDQVNGSGQTGRQGAEPFSIGDWKAIEPLFFRWKATAIIQGTYSYDNGFGRQITERACFQIVPNYHPSQTPMIQGASWVDCNRVPESLREYHRALREVARNK
jgi:hypothetical protein